MAAIRLGASSGWSGASYSLETVRMGLYFFIGVFVSLYVLYVLNILNASFLALQ